MALRPIVLYPDPVLLNPTLEVAEITDEVRDLVRDMVETMYAAPGIGLAANQVGSTHRVCVVDLVGLGIGQRTQSVSSRRAVAGRRCQVLADGFQVIRQAQSIVLFRNRK